MTDDNRLPEGWCQTSVDEAVEIHDDLREPVNAEERAKRPGPIPYYGATGQVGWIDDYLMDGEYVLLGEDGAPFLDPARPKAYRVVGKAWVNNHAHVLRGIDGVMDNRYLMYALNHADYRGYANGTTRLKLTQGAMRRLPIRLAPINEQRRIVAKIEELFSDLDAGVAALERARANLKRYRAAVLKAAVGGRLTAEWREKHPHVEPASKLLDRILAERRRRWEVEQEAKFAGSGKTPPKNWREKYAEPTPPDTSNLPELPDGWCWVTLGSLLRESLRNGHSARASGNGAGVRTLTLTAVTVGDFSEKNTKLTTAKPDEVGDLWLEPGDIFIERSNTPELVGTAKLYNGPRNFAIFPDLLVRLRVSSALVVEYIGLFLQSDFARSYFRLRAKGLAGSMPKIDQGTIMLLPVALPPLEEQLRIVDEVERLLSNITHTEVETEQCRVRAARLRQSILKRAFEGKLVPQNPDDEPASALLERIKAERQRTVPVAPRSKSGDNARKQTRKENRP